MGVTNANKQIDVTRIDCDGTLKVTLALSASPDITTSPTDIVLTLDRSGSMAGSPLANMKAGAKTFIDIIAQSTAGGPDTIGSGSRMAVVSFADTAVVNQGLTTSVADLKTAVDGLVASGSTNHADAFLKSSQLFDPASSNAKVIVLFTDGKTTSGPPPAPVAAAARAAGAIIYCIGLIGSDGVDVATLNEWATDPDASHVAVTPDDADLEELFKELAANISKTGATDIVIDETVSPDFTITSMNPPTRGSAKMTGTRTIQWTIPELGVTANEGASLSFFVQHTASTPGDKPVNASITYTDNEGNVVVFPDPIVTVSCGIIINPEPCPTPVDVTIDGCQDSALIDVGDVYLESLGRILQLNVTVKNVCPQKRVALAVVLTETDDAGMEYQRGMKTVTLPAHQFATCRDLRIRCLKFVLPEDLDVSGGTPSSLCNPRTFKVRLFANYLDTDFRCCESVITLL